MVGVREDDVHEDVVVRRGVEARHVEAKEREHPAGRPEKHNQPLSRLIRDEAPQCLNFSSSCKRNDEKICFLKCLNPAFQNNQRSKLKYNVVLGTGFYYHPYWADSDILLFLFFWTNGLHRIGKLATTASSPNNVSRSHLIISYIITNINNIINKRVMS